MMARQDDTGHAALVAAASRELACVVASAGAAAARALWIGSLSARRRGLWQR